jgi:GNAT superfamily N-acetyltransferase
MFEDMGILQDVGASEFEAAAESFFGRVLGGSDWFAWLAELGGKVVSGGVIYLSEMPPRNLPTGGFIPARKQGLVMNIFVEPEWRRKGIASAVLDHILAFGREQGLASVTLHASRDGRHVYEAMGFKPTNEMRLFL